MSWLKIDDQFFFHRKVINLSKDAKLLHLCAMTYCAAQARTGVLTPAVVRLAAAAVDAKTAAIAELVKAELWIKDEDGNYAIHDFTKYNPSPEQIASKKAGNAERQQRYRERHQPTLDEDYNGVIDSVSNGVTPHVTNAINNRQDNASLSRAPVNPSPSPNPLCIPNPLLETDRQTDTEGEVGRSVGPSGDGDSSKQNSASPPLGDSRFVEETLSEHPHWRPVLAEREAAAKPSHTTRYRAGILRNWLRGDGTPPVPNLSASLPALPPNVTMPPSPRPQKETPEEINSQLVGKLAQGGFFTTGGNNQ